MVEEDQIETERLQMDEAMHLVLHALSLYCPHPCKRAGQELGDYPEGSDAQSGCGDGLPSARSYHPIDKSPKQQRLGGGK